MIPSAFATAGHGDDDDILLTDDDDGGVATAQQPWTILVVDDEPDVHAMTALILGDAVFQGRGVALLAAHSADEARRILSQRDDVAVILLDVVMEDEHAGLDLVRWIRQTLGNREARIILRTGQPGQAPQRDVIVAYEINDYKSKAELSAEGLVATVITALRSYDLIRAIETRVERRTAELVDSREQMRTMLESSPVGVCAFDGDGRVIYANHRLGGMLGLPTARLSRISLAEMLATPDAVAEAGHWVRERRQLRDAETQFRRADGAAFWALVSADPASIDGQPVYLTWIYDITRRKLAEQQVLAARDLAEAATAAKSAFLATMTHEIRTPMNGVLGMLELLERSPLDARQTDTVAMIRDSAHALLAIIDDVLDYSKIEAGRMELEQIPVSLASVVEGVSEILAPTARAKGLDLLTWIDPAIPRSIYADAVRLRQILVNLAGNAVKFTESGSVILRADLVSHSDGWTEIAFEVIDTGIGITPQALAQLFQPFTQAESSISRRFGGSGLGLSISRRLAKLMHGEITVRSIPGAGSTFRLSAPFGVAPVEPTDMSGHEVPPEPDLDGLRVLIASPLLNERRFLADYFAAAGASPGMAATPEEVLSTCREMAGAGVPYDVLVLAEEIYAQAVGQAPDVLGRRAGEPRPSIALLAEPASDYVAALMASRPPGLEAVTRPARRGALLRVAATLAGRLAGDAGAAAPAAMSLPPRRPPPAGGPVCGPAPAPTGGDRARILVVDDNPINVKVATLQLDLLGYAADSAANGRDALALLQDNRYAAVLTDIQMPEMDGFALARHIRNGERDSGRRIPIVAVTAGSLSGDAYDGGEFDGVLSKPLSLERLADYFNDRSGQGVFATRRRATETATTTELVTETGGDDGAAPAESPAITLKTLETLCGGDREMMRDMLGDFLGVTEEVMAALRVAVAAADRSAIKAAAHNLRGSSRTAGALPLAAAAHAIEAAVSDPGQADFSALLPPLEQALSDLSDFVSAF